MLAVLIVEADPKEVDAALRAGHYRCSACGQGVLAPWGFARRRRLRDRGREVLLRPRRSRCASCHVTHVLLSKVAFLRRRDLAEVIGEALLGRFMEGDSRADVARRAGVHVDTARGWFRSFARRAGEIRVVFGALAHRLDPSLAPIAARGFAPMDALEAIGVAAAAARRQLGPAPLWSFVSGATGGLLLSNTNRPLPLVR